LASLNSARTKGYDASLKSQMSSFQQQAAIYYINNGQYDTGTTNVCTGAATGIFSDPQTKTIVASMITDAVSVTCQSTASTTAVSAVLKSNGTNWCVDSNENATTTAIQSDGLCI